MIMTNDISLPRYMYAFLSFYLRYKRISEPSTDMNNSLFKMMCRWQCSLPVLMRIKPSFAIFLIFSQSLKGRVLDGRRRLGMSAWSKIWKCVVYLRPAIRIEWRGDHLWRTVDRCLPRLTEALLRAWLCLRHGAFWGCAPAPLTKLDLIDWLIDE